MKKVIRRSLVIVATALALFLAACGGAPGSPAAEGSLESQNGWWKPSYSSDTGIVDGKEVIIKHGRNSTWQYFLAYVAPYNAVQVKAYTSRGWVQLGESWGSILGFARERQSNLSLVVDSGGYPLVAWIDDHNQIQIRRFNGSSWIDLQSGGLNRVYPAVVGEPFASDTSQISLAIDSLDRPVVASIWNTASRVGPRVRRLDGMEWYGIFEFSVAGPSDRYRNPSLAIGVANQPFFAFTSHYDSRPSYFCLLKMTEVRWMDGIRPLWSDVIPSLEGLGGPIPLVIDRRNNPLVAFVIPTGTQRLLYVRRLTSLGWSQTPLNVSNSGNPREPQLALDGDDNPVVAWQEDGVIGPRNIFVKRWKPEVGSALGGNWTMLGTSHLNRTINSKVASVGKPSLSVAGRSVAVAWTEVVRGRSMIFAKTYSY